MWNWQKNQAKTKQHPEVQPLLFENYFLSSSMLSFKTNKRNSRKCAKNKCVCFNEIIWLIVMKMRLKMKIRSHRCDINRIRQRHEHKYTKCKMCLTTMMVMCSKQHQSNIWSWIHEKVKQHWRWDEKSFAYIKKRVLILLLQNVCKTSWKDVFRHLQDVFKTYDQVKLLVLTRLQDIFETYSARFGNVLWRRLSTERFA